MDGGCNIVATTGMNTVIGLFYEASRVVGMIGPGCSTSSLQTAHSLNQPDIELVHIHGAGTHLLEDRQNYGNSIGILGSTRSFVHLSLALMRLSGWQKIAILFEIDRTFYRSSKELFVEELSRTTNTNIRYSSPIYASFYPLDGIRSSLARIVFAFTAPVHSLKIMCLAHHMRMIYPAYQWVLISRRLDDFINEVALLSQTGNFSFTYNRQIYNCSLDVMLNVSLNQTFLLSYQFTPLNQSEPRFVNLSFDQFIQLYKERVQISENASPTYWAYNFYDAVWAWALVLHRMIDKHGGIFDNFNYGNKTLANMTLEEFYAPEFEFKGMSGLISFNSSSGFYDRPSNLYQILNGEEILVAYSNRTDIVPLNENLNLIPDSFATVETSVSVIFIALFETLQFVLLIVVVVLHVLTVIYRDTKSVKASSTKLSHFAFAGVYTFLLGLILFVFPELRDHTSADAVIQCHVIWAFIFPTAFTLSIGTVAVRTWRLYRIFTHYLNPGRFISNRALMIVLIVMVSIDVIYASIWTAVDMREIVTFERTVENGPALEFIINTRCRSPQYEIVWIGLIFCHKFSLLVVMVVLTLLTRRIPNKTFATTSLRVFSYTFSATFTIGLGLYYFFLYFGSNNNSHVRYSILYLTLNACLILYIVCVFIPPLAPIFLNKLRNRKIEFPKSITNNLSIGRIRKTRKTSNGDDEEGRVRKTSKDALL